MSIPEIRLLGAIELHRAGTVVPLPGPRQRSLLAVLAMDVGRTVPVESLAARAWGEQPPERLRPLVQTHVWRLRATLGRDAIRTETGGYRLDLPREQIDVHAFADLCTAAAADPVRERALLREALSLWRGTPFTGETSEWLTNVAAVQIVDRYLRAVERRVDLDLAGGETDGLDSELHALLDSFPLRESLWLRLLNVLAAGGRGAEALHAYEALRLMLADQLGADPSTELQAAHVTLLRSEQGEKDGARIVADREPAGAGRAGERRRARRVPRQLPADIPHFVGRERVLAELDRFALDAVPDQPERRPTLALVCGPAGSGKTSAVIHWSHRQAAAFPDGQVFVNLRGFGSGAPMPVATALELVLRGLHVPGDRIPEGVEARSALLRSELADLRMLLVLDDARDSDHIRPLLPGGDSVVVVTSRSQLRSLVSREAAVRVELGTMSRAESVELLRLRAGIDPGAHARDPDSRLATLARQCGYLPLALAIAAEQAGRSEGDVTDLVAQLEDEQERLDVLAGGEDPLSDLRVVFAVSYRTLAHEPARTFRYMALHPSTVVSTGSMAALLDLDVRSTAHHLDRLVEANLLRRIRSGWFAIHDLVRLYAVARLEATDAPADRLAAVDRLRAWYAHSSEAACLRLWRYTAAIEPGPQLGTRPERFTSPQQAHAWFDAHRATLTDLIREADARGDHAAVCRLVPRFIWYLIRIGAADEHIAMCRLAVAHARAAGDQGGIGGASNNLGIAYAMAGQNEPAGVCFEAAEAACAAAGDRDGLTRVRNNIGALLIRTGHLDRATHLLEQNLAERQERPDDLEQCDVLRNLVNAWARRGDTGRAMALAREMLRIAQTHDHALHEAAAHDAVGTALIALGDPRGAAASYRSALTLYREVGDRPAVARQLKEVGRAEHASGRHDAAELAWTEALEVYRGDGVTGHAGPVEELEDLLAGLCGEEAARPATSGARRR